MEVISSDSSSANSTMFSSSLNPNAPLFVPMAFRCVEDFSDQWWDLVHSSPWFRDYWLRECFQDPQFDADQDSFFIDHFHSYLHPLGEEEEEEEEFGRDLVSMGALKWHGGLVKAEAPRYAQKVPKIVKSKMSPRTIQQPR